ncbi:MAG: LamG domain-containing protein [Planctomycetes bacterium]|nr:LamG domain-containing protein [Planctomycetota bacterium]
MTLPCRLHGLTFAALTLAPTTLAQNVGARFDPNVDGYLEVPYSPQVVPQSGITIEAWITYDDATLPSGWRYPTIVRQGLSVGGSEDYFLRINADNSNLKILRWKVVTSNGVAVTCNWTFTAGALSTWTHVAATYDGTAANLFVNGNQVATAAGNGLPIRDVGNEVFRIGKGSDVATPIEVWNGEIDEVRLWSFARTQADIQATMNQQLIGVPGYVSTWNLDGHPLDTSAAGLHATLNGTVVYNPNPLNLAIPALPLAVGNSTPGCLGELRQMPSAAAQLGNLGFSLRCARTPPSSIAIYAVSLAPLPFGVNVLGVDIWLDPTVLVTPTAIADGLGVLSLPFPIPATAPLGFSFATQCLVLDPCGPQGFTASDALVVTTQP